MELPTEDFKTVPLNAVIVGPGRCGSTALVGLLNQHPDVFCINESHSLPPLRRHFGAQKVATRALADCLLGLQFASGPWWPAQIISKGSAEAAGRDEADLRGWLDRLCIAEPEMKVKRFQGLVYGYFRHAAGAKRLIDKTPDYACHLDLVHEIWPRARVILMLRDTPRSVLSMRRHPGYRIMAAHGALSWGQMIAEQDDPSQVPELGGAQVPEDLDAYLDIWCARVQATLDHCRNLPEDQFMVLKHEDVLNTPEQAAAQLLEFLDLPGDETWARIVAEGFHPKPLKDDLSEATQAAAAHPQAMALRRELEYL